MDNFLEIGATVILEGLSAGMDSAQEIVGESTSAMEGMFASLGESSAAATTTIVEGAAVAGEAVQGMSERFVEAAEAANLSAAGIGSAFSGLSVLLGGGLIAGFAASFINEAEKAVLEIGHLSEKTGIAIETLGGLQVITRELGVEFSAVETGLIRLERAQALAVSGGKSQAEALHRIGLSVADIRDLNPEELLMKVAEAIQRTSSSADTAAAAIALFGRGGAALIPIFKEYGGTLQSVTKAKAELSGMTEEAYEQSKQYQKATADLSIELRKLAIDAFPAVTWAAHKVVDVFSELRASMSDTMEVMLAITDPAQAIGDALVNAFTKVKKVTKDGDDPFGLKPLLSAVNTRFPAPNVPTDISADKQPKAKKDTSTSDKVKQDQKDFDELFRAKQKFADEEDKLNLQEVEQYQKIQDIESDAFAKHEIAKLELARKTIDEELKDKKISSAEAEKLLTDLEEKEYKIRKDAIVARIKLEEETTDNPVVLAKLNAELEALADQHEAKMTEIHIKGLEARAKADEEAEKKREKLEKTIETSFARSIDDMLLHSRNFHDAVTRLWQDLASSIVKHIVAIATKWITEHIIMIAIEKLFQKVSGEDPAGDQRTKNARKALQADTTQAEADVFAQAIAAIPFPANLAAAPAAAALVGVQMGIIGSQLVSAAGGWDVPRDSLALIHKNEMVLPAPLADEVRNRTSGRPGAETDRDVHVHFTTTIQAIDAQGFERVIQTHNQALGRQIVRLFRNGNLKLDHALR